ncbi:hypothetical protein COU57_05015 [Candidatus Pacearchaeota archaeon CG10_big_fil_rev_8_21_14_0_10_32_14]|nr:MAG: hypothetical protein COU57_05015 [Candidatus Pacearchaeota archaeon CG10_big_fil_rev_8_21_14_0_10_32_14]
MILRKIQLNNIRSYNEEEIEFPIGSTLLSGDIGSGKTTILLGIEFALFGLQPGQKGSSILKNNVKEGYVKLELEIDGKIIEIERTLKRAKTITQDSCCITIDGNKRELAVTELKNVVLDLLNYPKEFSKKQNILYKFTVYTPQEEMKQIISQDIQTRVNTIRHIFGIDKYKKILENTSIILSKLREERRLKEGIIVSLEEDKSQLTIKETEIETKHYNLSSVERELFLKKELRKKFQEEQKKIQEKIEEKRKLELEVEKFNIMINNKNNSLSENKRLLIDLNNQIKEYDKYVFDDSKLPQLEKEIHSIKNDLTSLNEEVIKLTSGINSHVNKNEESQGIKEKIMKIDVCPTCLQDVDHVYKSNVFNKIDYDVSTNKREIEELQTQKLKIREKVEKLKIQLDQRDKEYHDLRILKVRLQSIDEKKKRIKDIEKVNKSLSKDIEMLHQSSEIQKKSIFDLKRYDLTHQEKQKDIDNAFKEERTAEIKVAELRKEIDMSVKLIDILRIKIEKAEDVKKQLGYIMSLENWFTEKFIPMISYVEKNVMSSIKVQFSELFNKWFCMLVPEGFSARIDEEFTPIIEQQDYEVDYDYLSGGERTAVALAYRLSLNQVINSLMSDLNTKDIIILDEPTDGFSDQQLDKIRDILMQLNVKQLLLVSHEHKIEGFVENILRFKKENGISRLEHKLTEAIPKPKTL